MRDDSNADNRLFGARDCGGTGPVLLQHEFCGGRTPGIRCSGIGAVLLPRCDSVCQRPFEETEPRAESREMSVPPVGDVLRAFASRDEAQRFFDRRLAQ